MVTSVKVSLVLIMGVVAVLGHYDRDHHHREYNHHYREFDHHHHDRHHGGHRAENHGHHGGFESPHDSINGYGDGNFQGHNRGHGRPGYGQNHGQNTGFSQSSATAQSIDTPYGTQTFANAGANSGRFDDLSRKRQIRRKISSKKTFREDH